MTDPVFILALLVAVMVYSLFARRIERSVVTLPMVFTAAGWALGAGGAQMVDMETGMEIVHVAAEVTLVLVLFNDASRVRLGRLARNAAIPARMLLIGMPLTLLFGTTIAALASPTVPLAAALLVAAILTPTDAALGQAFAGNAHVPERVRQAVNVESGLNDGLALPIVMIAAVLASGAGAYGPAADAPGEALRSALMPIVLGPAVGIGVGFIAARLADWAVAGRHTTQVFEDIFALCVAFATFLIAGEVGGNGFIAAFVAGAVYGNAKRSASDHALEFMEGQGQLLTMFAFVVFGVALVPEGLAHASWTTLLVAVAFLTVVRVVPIWISLLGTGLPPLEKLCLGWFGPRGLASVLFSLMVLDTYDVPGIEEILACVVLTVLLSIVLHGLSAAPLTQRFAAEAKRVAAASGSPTGAGK